MPGEVKVMVPTDRAEQIGVRNVIGKEEAEKVISILGEDETEMSQNWNKDIEIIWKNEKWKRI